MEVCVAAFLKATYLKNNTVVVLRFWNAMLNALVNFVERGAYSRCCSQLQVSYSQYTCLYSDNSSMSICTCGYIDELYVPYKGLHNVL